MADILQKSHRGLRVGGEQMVPSNQTHENITGFTVYPENLYLQARIMSVRLKSLNSSPSFPEKKKKWKSRREEKEKKKTLKQTTGMQLHSISCSMLFLSQGLFRCTNWVEVGNGHESKPVFPSALGLMRATWRNVGSHSTPLPHGLLQDDKKETMPSFFESNSIHCGQKLKFIHSAISILKFRNIFPVFHQTHPA